VIGGIRAFTETSTKGHQATYQRSNFYSEGDVHMDIGINDKTREKIAEGLARLLADSYTLYIKTHGFHWNVTGPMFNTLHLMFMDQYTELWN
jgi:hypothetical protein